MRILVLSDLHLEFGAFETPAAQADLVVLAGDTHTGSRGVRWARDAFGDIPVVYVMGNHEYYGEAYPALLDEVRREADSTNVHLLENQLVSFGEITFLG